MSITGWTLDSAIGVDVIRITNDNYDDIVPKGKEVDAIIGDWVLRNESVWL